MSRNAVITIVVIVVVLLGGWYLLRPKQTVAPESSPVVSTPVPAETSIPASEGAIMKEGMVVNITPAGFSPKSVTIKVGESVTWMNTDSADHQVNSSPHPTHTDYPPLNTIGLLKSGEKKSLTFPTAGIYKYHDHLNPSNTGSVTVE